MRDENEPGSEAQEQRGAVSVPIPHAVSRGRSGWITVADRIIGPLAFFVSIYLATFLVALRLTPWTQWAAFVSVVVATVASVALWDRGRWNLGLIVPPALAVRESLLGMAVAAGVIGGADLLVVLTTEVRRQPGNGFPFFELVAVFIPAVLHEELLFRGYAFQRLWSWSRWLAVALGSVIFAALHAWNQSVTPLALINILLGGVLLSLAWERYRRLWFPIGLHFGWNLMSGPILGYEVSGYVPGERLLRTSATGPVWLTGGAFGIEGSIWITVVVLVAIVMTVVGPTPDNRQPTTDNRNT
ncbi:MAG: type II CAAX endopeptidase family protein [Thermoanaerobaculia bacterium]